MEDTPNVPSPFDVKTIKYLVRLMGRHDLTELDLRDGALRIRLRRGPNRGRAEEISPLGAAPLTTPTPVAAPPPVPAKDEAPAKQLLEIKSPTPGTFYTAANPESEPFVRVGARVQPNTVVCIIEAMKVFNEITADCSGTISAIIAENQQPVEYGQVLFKVDPTT